MALMGLLVNNCTIAASQSNVIYIQKKSMTMICINISRLIFHRLLISLPVSSIGGLIY